MTKIYVLRNDDNEDYVRVFTTIDKAIKALEEDLVEDFIILEKEEKKEIKERAKAGYTYAYTSEENPFSITWTNLE